MPASRRVANTFVSVVLDAMPYSFSAKAWVVGAFEDKIDRTVLSINPEALKMSMNCWSNSLKLGCKLFENRNIRISKAVEAKMTSGRRQRSSARIRCSLGCLSGMILARVVEMFESLLDIVGAAKSP